MVGELRSFGRFARGHSLVLINIWRTCQILGMRTKEEFMKKLQILGTGCAKCKKLYAEAEKAIAVSGTSTTLQKVEQIDEIMKYGVMVTPALVIDEEVKCAGRIPSTSEIVAWLSSAGPGEK